MAKKYSPYFDDFIAMSSFSVQAGKLLYEAVADFKPEEIGDYRTRMHEIENAADAYLHQTMEKLAKEFVTPIDREDIIRLLHILDDLVDRIEDVLIRIFMYDIKAIMEEAIALAEVITRAVGAVEKAMEEFPQYKKSSQLVDYFIDINNLEEEADLIYINAVHNLFTGGEDATKILAWCRIYDKLEDCCDTCEGIAEAMESVAMQNA